jgi:hypothetical protein
MSIVIVDFCGIRERHWWMMGCDPKNGERGPGR